MDTTNITQGWDLRDGIDPDPLREAAAERAARKKDEADQRNAERDREDKDDRERAEEQVEPFHRRLGELLGTEIPADAITISRTYPGYEAHCYLAKIEEKRDYLHDEWISTSRELIAVWNDGTIHIRVRGESCYRRHRHFPQDRSETWDAGPVETTEDLLRIIEQRGNTQWTPPTKNEPEPEPATEPVTAADRAQTLLEQLATNPRNQRGLRGALIALAWSNLATRQN